MPAQPQQDDEDEEDGPVVVGMLEDTHLTVDDELRGTFPMAFGESFRSQHESESIVGT